MDTKPGRVPEHDPLVETAIDDGESPGQVVGTAVAAVADATVTDLPPLYDTIDPDALAALFPECATSGSVAFSYDQYLVVVTADRAVEVYDEESSA